MVAFCACVCVFKHFLFQIHFCSIYCSQPNEVTYFFLHLSFCKLNFRHFSQWVLLLFGLHFCSPPSLQFPLHTIPLLTKTPTVKPFTSKFHKKFITLLMEQTGQINLKGTGVFNKTPCVLRAPRAQWLGVALEWIIIKWSNWTGIELRATEREWELRFQRLHSKFCRIVNFDTRSVHRIIVIHLRVRLKECPL